MYASSSAPMTPRRDRLSPLLLAFLGSIFFAALGALLGGEASRKASTSDVVPPYCITTAVNTTPGDVYSRLDRFGKPFSVSCSPVPDGNVFFAQPGSDWFVTTATTTVTKSTLPDLLTLTIVAAISLVPLLIITRGLLVLFRRIHFAYTRSKIRRPWFWLPLDTWCYYAFSYGGGLASFLYITQTSLFVALPVGCAAGFVALLVGRLRLDRRGWLHMLFNYRRTAMRSAARRRRLDELDKLSDVDVFMALQPLSRSMESLVATTDELKSSLTAIRTELAPRVSDDQVWATDDHRATGSRGSSWASWWGQRPWR